MAHAAIVLVILLGLAVDAVEVEAQSTFLSDVSQLVAVAVAYEPSAPGTRRPDRDRAAKAVRDCYNGGARDMHQMAVCSGFLLSQEGLAACLLDAPKVVCVPPPLCPRRVTEEPKDGSCRLQPAWMRKPVTAEIRRLTRYGPVDMDQAIRGSLPAVPDLDALKASCEKESTKKGMEACVSRLAQTPKEREAIDCVQKRQGNLLAVATECLGVAVKLADSERKLVQCAMQANSRQSAQACARDQAFSEIPAERRVGLVRCGAGSRDPMMLGGCLLGLEPWKEGEQYVQTAKCLDESTGRTARLGNSKCLAKVLPAEQAAKLRDAAAYAECAEKKTAMDCLPDMKEAKKKVDCARRATQPFDDRLLTDCADSKLLKLDEADQKRIDCFRRHRNDAGMLAAKCVAEEALKAKGISPEVVQCAGKVAAATDMTLEAQLARCNKDFAKVAQYKERFAKCGADRDVARKANRDEDDVRVELGLCLAGGEAALPPEVACAVRSTPKSFMELAHDCGSKMKLPIGGDSKKVVDCYRNSKGDRWLTGLCVAGVKVDPRNAALYACLSDSTDLGAKAFCAATPLGVDKNVVKIGQCMVENGGVDASTALCAANLRVPLLAGLNPEWRTAVQCAATSGGEPTTTTSCLATRLTLAEITKCFSGGVGKSGGCFGPNNTIVKFYRDYVRVVGRILKAVDPGNIARDLTKGPGPNHEVRKAGRNAEKEVRRFFKRVF